MAKSVDELRTTMAIGREFYSGDLGDVLRNFVDEMSIRTQQGTFTNATGILNNQTTKAVTFETEMPSTDYEVFVQFNTQPSADFGEFWVDTKTTTGFTVNVAAHPGANGVGFCWLARHNTRLNTKYR